MACLLSIGSTRDPLNFDYLGKLRRLAGEVNAGAGCSDHLCWTGGAIGVKNHATIYCRCRLT